MQPITGAPRTALTAAQVTALLRDDPSPEWSAGMELLNPDLSLAEDISTDLIASGSSVERHAYSNLHGTARFSLSRELDWGRAVVRPYVTITGSSGTPSARFNLGAYYTSTPSRVVESNPLVYSVQGYDVLSRLADPVGDAYAVGAGESYLQAVAGIFAATGASAYLIDQAAAASVLPTGRTWAFDARMTWLTVVNDLLAAIGYAGVWSDWDGRLRAAAYVTPSARAPEWTYVTSVKQSMLGPRRELINDYFDAPNRWVFYRTNNTDQAAPVEGAGKYTVLNLLNGPTSIEARGGRVITKPVGLDVADQAALIAAAQITIDADLRLGTKLHLTSFPNPLHWHFDMLRVDDPALGTPLACLGTASTLPLDGGDMTHEFTVVPKP